MKTLTPVLLALFMLVCAGTAASTPIDSSFHRISTASATTAIQSLPIDPVKIFDTWKPLQIERFQKNVAVVLFGNPKIEWTEDKVRCAFDQPIPEKDIAASVAITLFKGSNEEMLLTQFMFVNTLGILEFYIHEKEAGTFVRRPHPTQRLI